MCSRNDRVAGSRVTCPSTSYETRLVVQERFSLTSGSVEAWKHRGPILLIFSSSHVQPCKSGTLRVPGYQVYTVC